ncbi:uncharacterized protein LOC129819103 isoform X2 [Salvelinus fontinalis]|uniref:uncharacterized protein LOC129819103 isoform X2 n=1 Tax=Salvelinus fontinalis TaxID=8038 RepID=UPI002486C262|nr:uncharacterized protein LOC129819103 isoform X2 [Salvelinus fontinalis]
MVSRLSFSLLLIASRLSGMDGIRLMSVWTGDSIAIPCIYHQDYINHVKYWCKGDSWNTCSYVVRTDHPNSSDSPIVDQEETGVELSIQEIFAVQTTTQFTTTITMPIPTTQELSVMTGEYALSSSTSQASVNNTHHGAQRWERTLFYLTKTVNAVVFLLCTIMAVVKYRTNRLRSQTED